VIFSEGHFDEMNDESNGVHQKNLVVFSGERGQWVNDGRSIEKSRGDHLPNLADVSKSDIKRGHHKRKTHDNNVGHDDVKEKDQNRKKSWPKAIPDKESGNDKEIHQKN